MEKNSNIFMRIINFLKYWYLRYSLVTELYMLEPWEKVVIQILIMLGFFLLWFINYAALISGVGRFINFIRIQDDGIGDALR